MELFEEQRQQSSENVTSYSDEDVPRNEAYTVNAFAKMNVFRKRGQLCDVVIKVGGREFLAHRVVLAATSDYFDAMFSNGMAESVQLEVELKSISPDIMDALLDYVYTGQVRVTMDNVQDLLPAASLVQMEGVKTACSNFLLAEVDSSNVLGIRRFAELHNCAELEKFARNFAAHNFEVVVEFEEFLCLNHEELLDLVSREDLHIDCEESVYKAVMRWVYHQVPERSPHLPTLLGHIRLPVMSVRFLTDVVDKDTLIRQSLECRDLVDDAKRYHLRPDLRHQMRERRYQQRDSGDEYLVVIGGFGSDQNPSDSVEMFNPRTLEWCELPDLPISYRYVAACSLDTCVYVIGGFDGRERLNTVCLLDIAQREEGWRWLTPMHFKRGLSAACTHKGLIYVCGGFDGQSRLRSLEVYHPKIDEWRILEDMNTAREGAGLVVVDNSLYCLGGYDGFHLLNSMEAFDLTRGTWTMCKPMYMRRSGAGCALLGDTIYVCGGYGGAEGRGPLHLDTVEAYNTRLQQWTLVNSMNVPRCYVGACPLAGKIYVAAGYNGSSLLDTVESYDPVENQWWLHDESRMNHERCDTGMCVVRFLSCTESPAPNTSSIPPSTTATVSSSTAVTTVAVSTSTGQMLSIRPPLDSISSRHTMIPGLHRSDPSAGSVWSGSYPNRSHAPGMHALASHTTLRSGPSTSGTFGGTFSSGTPWCLPPSSLLRRPVNRRRPIIVEDTPGSSHGVDLLSRAFQMQYPWSARQLLTVSGLGQVGLNRWMTHYPGPETNNLLSNENLEADPVPSFPSTRAFTSNSVSVPLPLNSTTSAPNEQSSFHDHLFGDPTLGHFTDEHSPCVTQTTGDHLPHILDHTSVTAHPSVESGSPRESNTDSPTLLHRLGRSAPETDLCQSIYTDVFAPTDQLHYNQSRRLPWLLDERNNAFTGAYPFFTQFRRDCGGSEDEQRACHSPASPGSLSRLGLLRCLSLNEDEDEALSDDSAANDAAAYTPTDVLASDCLPATVVPTTNPSPTQSQCSMQSALSEPLQTTHKRGSQPHSASPTVCEWPSTSGSSLLRQAPSDVLAGLHKKTGADKTLPSVSPHPGLGCSTTLAPLDQPQIHPSGDVDHTFAHELSNEASVVQPHVDSAFPSHLFPKLNEVPHSSAAPDPLYSVTTAASSRTTPTLLDHEGSRSDGEGEEADNLNPAGVRDPAIGQPDEDDV